MCETEEELYMTVSVCERARAHTRACVCVCGNDGDSIQTKLSICDTLGALPTKCEKEIFVQTHFQRTPKLTMHVLAKGFQRKIHSM